MKDLWTAIFQKMVNDTTLVSMTSYTINTNTIKRGNSLHDIQFSSTVNRAVTFQQWTDTRSSRSSTNNMKDITVLFSCYSKKGDIQCIELSDYLQTLFNECSLTNASINNFYSEFDDFVTAPYYDKDEQVWRIDLRFRFKVSII